MTRVEFMVPGDPRGKERARVAPGQSRPYTPAATVKAEREVGGIARAALGAQPMISGPYRLTITAIFAVPPSWPKKIRDAIAGGEMAYHVSKPDRDNIEKLVMDACNKVVWYDDAFNAEGGVRKRYGHPARTEVLIESLGGITVPATKRLDAQIADGTALKPKAKKGKGKTYPPHVQAKIEAAIRAVEGPGKRIK